MLARMLTFPHITADRNRRTVGLGLAGAGALLLAIWATVATAGALQVAAGTTTAVLAALSAAKLWQAHLGQRQHRWEQRLLGELAVSLPTDYYILADLHLPASWGERVHIWALAVTPGGLVVIQPCMEEGNFYPAGPVWVVEQDRGTRVISSPVSVCHKGIEVLREAVDLADVPVWPLVVLTDPHGSYYPARAEALVIGAPHLAETVRRCGAGQAIGTRDALQLAAELCRFSAR